MNTIAGWGRYPVVQGVERLSEDLEAATRDALLVRGLGRSYGDASLPPRAGQTITNSTLADRLIAFDAKTGILRAEAGFSLFDLNRLFLQRGWAMPVSPGTQFVTLGGMVASDVHGKNHHLKGSVRRIQLPAHLPRQAGRRVPGGPASVIADHPSVRTCLDRGDALGCRTPLKGSR